MEVVRRLDEIACGGRKPDLTIWVDIDLETSLGRARQRNEDEAAADRMDAQSRAFFEKVLEGYRRLSEEEPGRVRRVDGRGTVDAVAQRVWAVFETLRGPNV